MRGTFQMKIGSGTQEVKYSASFWLFGLTLVCHKSQFGWKCSELSTGYFVDYSYARTMEESIHQARLFLLGKGETIVLEQVEKRLDEIAKRSK